jgi:hypothetical protein
VDRRWRARVPAVATAVLCVVAVAAGLLLATGAATPAVALASSGHWVVNAAENAVAHVDGGTAQVDARVELPADAGGALFALEGDRQGFVVGRERVTVFGRSTLTVDTSFPVEFAEEPLGIETVGGPYLVYRTAGTVVRLGVPPLSLPVGGPVGRPVWTDDGTVWLQRTDDGSFCAVRAGADGLDCSTGAAPGEPGGLTVAGTDAAFVGTRRDAAHVLVTRSGPVGLGADVAEAALLADRDTEGRLAVVEPDVDRLVLTDSAGIPAGRAGGPAIVVELGPGEFSAPAAAAGVVAVLDLATNRLLTYDAAGVLLGSAQLPPGGAPSLTRGRDGRIYVDDADGASTHVIGPGGVVTSVMTGGRLPDTVTVAAPPQRSSPVSPPSRDRPVDRTVPGDGAGPLPVAPVRIPPAPQPGPGPGPSPQPAPGPDPVTELVLPPVTVVARAQSGGTVVVEWTAAERAQSYVVRGGGLVRETTGLTATIEGLPRGRAVTFTVQSVAADRRSVESAPSAPVTPFGPPAAPTGLRATPSCDDDCSAANLVWQQPDLGGGRLVHYLVTGAQDGRDLRTQRVAQPSVTYSYGADYEACGVVVFAVQAVVTGADGGEEVTGPEAVHTFGGLTAAECTPTASIDSVALDGLSMTIDVGEGRTGRGTCTVSLNGVQRDARTCGREPTLPGMSADAEYATYQVSVDGLDPDTTYSVEVTAANGYGSTTSFGGDVTTGPA